MTKFEVGDRVKYNGVAKHGPWADRKRLGTLGVVEELPSYEGGSYTIRFEDVNGVGYVGSSEANALIKLNDVSALIGPAPEPVEAPQFVIPFESSNEYVRDANRKTLLEVIGGRTTQDDHDLAKAVAKALNAYFEEK